MNARDLKQMTVMLTPSVTTQMDPTCVAVEAAIRVMEAAAVVMFLKRNANHIL